MLGHCRPSDSRRACRVRSRGPKTADRRRKDGPADTRDQFNSADLVGDNRVIFDIGGNKYGLVAHVYYPHNIVLTKFVDTHIQYDRIDPETVEP